MSSPAPIQRPSAPTRDGHSSHLTSVPPDATNIEEEALLRLISPQLPRSSPELVAVPDDPVVQGIISRTRDDLRVAQEILDRSVPDTTRHSYAAHVRAWSRWCRQRRVDPLRASVSDVLAFLAGYAVEYDEDGRACRDADGELLQARAVASLGIRVAAIRRIYVHAGLSSPTDDPAVREFLAGLRRTFGVRTRYAKGAIDQAMLRRILAHCAPQPEHLRRWALILLRATTRCSVAAARNLAWPDVNPAAREVTLVGRPGSPKIFRIDQPADDRLDLITVLADLREQSGETTYVFSTVAGRRVARQSLHATLSTAEQQLGGELAGARPARLLGLYHDIVDRGMAKPLRDIALLTAGWWGANRRSELSASQWRDMQRRPDGHWTMQVRFSKTDQAGEGATLFLPRTAEDSAACPSRAMDRWHAHVTRLLGSDPIRTHQKVPVFASVDRYGRVPADPASWTAMSGQAINLLVQQLVVAAGVESPDRARSTYGAHSLRAGFVTEALRHDEVRVEDVQKVTRHKSIDVLIRYRRELLAFETSPVHRLLTALEVGDD